MGTFNGLRIGNRASKSFTWLTERMRRYELIFKLKTHTQAEVVKVLYKLERKHKGKFNDIFKTITCDNGSEF